MKYDKYIVDGVEYITHKDALTYYGCVSTTLRNWRREGRIKTLELPLKSARLYELNSELREYHLGGMRFDKK